MPFYSMLIRFLICVVVSWIIIDRLYYRKSKRRDFYFTFMLIIQLTTTQMRNLISIE